MNAFFDDQLRDFVHALAWALLHFLWQGAALASACALAMITAHKCSARTRYIIGCATLAAMALVPVFTLMWMLRQSAEASASAPLGLGVGVAAFDNVQPEPSGMNAALLIVVIIWAAGCAACTLCLAGGWMQTRALRRLTDVGLPERCREIVDRISAVMRVRASVRLVESAAVVVPMTMGWLTPVILLPASLLAGLPPKQLEAIIAHELAHVRRFDYLVNIFQLLVESLLFYHPAVWWVSRRVRLEREYCCDDLAVMACGDRLLYARALTELETLRGVSAHVRLGLSSNGGSLMKRIARLIDHHGSGQATSARLPAMLAACALLASASAALAFMNPQVISALAAAANPQEPQAPTFTYEVTSGKVAFAWAGAASVDLEGAGPGPADDAKAAYINRWLRMWDIQATQAEVEANGEVWHLMNAVAQQVDRASDEFDAMDQKAAAAWIGFNAQYGDEMPSEALQKAARQLYPFNLFDLMPWISPAAHPLICPPNEEATIRLESFSMPQHGKWIAVVKEPSTHTEIHGESTNGDAIATWARAVSWSIGQVEFELPHLERPALHLEDVLELPLPDASDVREVTVEGQGLEEAGALLEISWVLVPVWEQAGE